MNIDEIEQSFAELNEHELFSHVDNLESLRFFMERHVFAVWDFMCLMKSLQNYFAPSDNFWSINKNTKFTRFINEIVLAEESDLLPNNTPLSHFEMYLEAMNEVSANSLMVLEFLSSTHNLNEGLAQIQNLAYPESVRSFTSETLEVVSRGNILEVAAYFCFGREKIIPDLFQGLLDGSKLTSESAPMFHYYLNRHIEIDGDSHGPIAIEMMKHLIDGDKQKEIDAISFSKNAIAHRKKFFDTIKKELEESKA